VAVRFLVVMPVGLWYLFRNISACLVFLYFFPSLLVSRSLGLLLCAQRLSYPTKLRKHVDIAPPSRNSPIFPRVIFSFVLPVAGAHHRDRPGTVLEALPEVPHQSNKNTYELRYFSIVNDQPEADEE